MLQVRIYKLCHTISLAITSINFAFTATTNHVVKMSKNSLFIFIFYLTISNDLLSFSCFYLLVFCEEKHTIGIIYAHEENKFLYFSLFNLTLDAPPKDPTYSMHSFLSKRFIRKFLDYHLLLLLVKLKQNFYHVLSLTLLHH